MMGTARGILGRVEPRLACIRSIAHVMKIDFRERSDTTIFIRSALYHE